MQAVHHEPGPICIHDLPVEMFTHIFHYVDWYAIVAQFVCKTWCDMLYERTSTYRARDRARHMCDHTADRLTVYDRLPLMTWAKSMHVPMFINMVTVIRNRRENIAVWCYCNTLYSHLHGPGCRRPEFMNTFNYAVKSGCFALAKYLYSAKYYVRIRESHLRDAIDSRNVLLMQWLYKKTRDDTMKYYDVFKELHDQIAIAKLLSLQPSLLTSEPLLK